jgi:hypothetical protein
VRSDDVTVVARGFTAYPLGFSFHLDIRGPATRRIGPWGPTGPAAALAPTGAATSALRLSIAFSDGRTATDVAAMAFPHDGSGWVVAKALSPEDADNGRGLEPAPPVLVATEARLDAATWLQDYWVWGVPPPGPVTLSLHWAMVGIEHALASVSGNVLSDAIRGAAQG